MSIYQNDNPPPSWYEPPDDGHLEAAAYDKHDPDSCEDINCESCYEEYDYPDDEDNDYYGEISFAGPGGNSALRAVTASNPRNQPCPTCGADNVLTSQDIALRYQCDACADRAERDSDY